MYGYACVPFSSAFAGICGIIPTTVANDNTVDKIFLNIVTPNFNIVVSCVFDDQFEYLIVSFSES